MSRKGKFTRLLVAVLLVVFILTGIGWWRWTKTDTYQIQQIIKDAPQLGDQGKWSKALALSGRSNEAAVAASEVWGPLERSLALTAVAEILIKVGMTEEALAAAHEIRDPLYRSRALGPVVEALTKAGKMEEARHAVEDALKAAREYQHERRSDVFPVSAMNLAISLAAEAKALGAAQRTEEAKEAAKKALSTALGIPRDRGTERMVAMLALAIVAEALAKLGMAEEALAAASENWSSMGSHVQTLIAVAIAFAKAGKTERAIAVARATETDTRLSFGLHYSQALIALAEILAKTEKAEKLIKVAREISDHYSSDRSLTLTAMAKALAKVGRHDEAKQVLEKALADAQVSGGRSGLDALSAVAEVLIKVGETEKGQQAAEDALKVVQRGLRDSTYYSHYLATVVGALARTGKITDALTIAREISVFSDRSQALVGVSKAIAETGKTTEAKKLLEEALDIASEKIAEEHTRSETIAMIAEGFASLKEYRKARLLAIEWCISYHRLSVYTKILLTHAKDSNPNLARLLKEEEFDARQLIGWPKVF